MYCYIITVIVYIYITNESINLNIINSDMLISIIGHFILSLTPRRVFVVHECSLE